MTTPTTKKLMVSPQAVPLLPRPDGPGESSDLRCIDWEATEDSAKQSLFAGTPFQGLPLDFVLMILNYFSQRRLLKISAPLTPIPRSNPPQETHNY